MSNLREQLEAFRLDRGMEHYDKVCDMERLDSFHDGADAFIPIIEELAEALEFYANILKECPHPEDDGREARTALDKLQERLK